MTIEINNTTMSNLSESNSNDKKKLYSFPAFVANSADLMFKYNDQSFDLDCLNSEEGQKAIQLSEQCLFNIKPVNRICTVGGNRIMSPDNYIFIPLLTSNENEALYKFNFLTFDRNNLGKWNKRDEFIEVAKRFKNEGKWTDSSGFKFLDDLIKQMNQQ